MFVEIYCEKCTGWVRMDPASAFTCGNGLACGLSDPLYIPNVPDWYRRQVGAPKDPHHVAAEAFLEQLLEEPEYNYTDPSYIQIPEVPMSALDNQVGGDHYKNQAIQPIQYIFENDLGFCEGNVVKYVTRYQNKNGIQDLKKARHYLDMLIERLESE